jgi:arginine utilization protein RocB
VKDEIESLTKKIVSIASVNGTEGEKRIGEFIEKYLCDIPCFQAHPE